MRPELSGYLGSQQRPQHWRILFAVVLSLFFVLALTADAWARSSGGRYGGRAGFSRSRSSPSGGWSGSRPSPTRPYSPAPSPGYTPPMSSPGFGFLPFLLPFLGWGGGIGGGGGFGFGGIFTLLIILGIVVLVGKVLLQNLATARRYRRDSPSSMSMPLGEGRYAVVKCQIALLSTARSLQRDLQAYASAATTDTVAGLGSALQDVTMALVRFSDYWRAGAVQVQHAATLDDAERVFNQAVGQERAKLSEELTVNVEGVRRQAAPQETAVSEDVGRYLVVTLIVATGYPEFTSYQTPSAKDIEATLQRLGTLLTSDLLALEVIWSPENPGDTLTEDELIAEYPELSTF